MTPRRALARRAWRDGRTRTLSFASLFLIYAYVQPVGYRHTYATAADRLGFARSFGGNTAIRLFYGEPHDLLSTGGYTAWRVGGVAAILAALWGLLAAVRALRAEEDAGRTEVVLAGIVARRDTFAAAAAAIVAGIAVLLVAMTAGLVLGALAFGDSLLLALATVSVAFVFAGIGALCSQLAPTRRVALELGTGVLAVVLRRPCDRRHVQRRGVAAVADAAGMGRGGAAVHRRAAVGPALAVGHRHTAVRRVSTAVAAAGHRWSAAAGARPRRAAAVAAVVDDRAGAARRARQPRRLGLRGRRPDVRVRLDLDGCLDGRHPQAGKRGAPAARDRTRSRRRPATSASRSCS